MMWKILVVDDQDCIRNLITETLSPDGYEMHAAGDAQSVRQILMSSQPDLVLLDLYLDGPEGFGLLQEIKRQHPSLPVIIVTAYDSHRDDPRLREADGYIVKSVEFWDEMRQKVADVLRKTHLVQPKTEREVASARLRGTEINTCKMVYEGTC
jgi:DNA-binding response OmpR family regulator